MRKILTAVLGLLCGIAIIVMAFQFNATVDSSNVPTMDTLRASGTTPIVAEDAYSASYEWDKYYGGDAYSGIQQAAAQTANNVLALEETLQQTNNDLDAINKNLIATNSSLATINNNLVIALQAQAKNQNNATATSVTMTGRLGFFLLLAIGMLTEVKYLGQLLDGIAENRKDKVQVAPAVEETAIPAQESEAEVSEI